MPFYTCTVMRLGRRQTEQRRLTRWFINLTDTQGNFTNLWFYAADGGQNRDADRGPIPR